MPDHPPPQLADTAVRLLAVFALVLANGFFVAAEFVLVAARKTRIDQMATEGNRSAALARHAMDNLSHYIAATQVGVTLASLLLGGMGEKTLEPLLAYFLQGLPPEIVGVTRAGIATAIAYVIMTALHVVIGELMPKEIALQRADTLVLWLVYPIAVFAKLVTPVVWVLNGIGIGALRLLGFDSSGEHEPVHSPEEIAILLRRSHQGGEINPVELDIFINVMRFSDITAREVMVPRVEMQALPVEPTVAELGQFLRSRPHSRVPVFHDTMDDIVGIVHLKELVPFAYGLTAVGNERANLMPLMRETARVPESITIDRLLLDFKRRRQAMAIVIDEYGGTAGLVTMGDLIEQVFGDVPDEFDKPEPEIMTRPDGTLEIPGRMLIDDVNERFGLDFDTEQADTMAGLVQTELGRPGSVGDEVTIAGIPFRVEQVDRLRITGLSMRLTVSRRLNDNQSD